MAMFRYRNYCKNFPHTCQTKTKTSVYRNRWTSVNIYILYFQRHMYVCTYVPYWYCKTHFMSACYCGLEKVMNTLIWSNLFTDLSIKTAKDASKCWSSLGQRVSWAYAQVVKGIGVSILLQKLSVLSAVWKRTQSSQTNIKRDSPAQNHFKFYKSFKSFRSPNGVCFLLKEDKKCIHS